MQLNMKKKGGNTKGHSKLVNRSDTDKYLTKKTEDKENTKKTINRKSKTERHETLQNWMEAHVIQKIGRILLH